MRYLTYLSRLSKYTRSRCVKAKQSNTIVGGGEWDGENRVISLNFTAPITTVVSAWLHELGHELDEAISTQQLVKKIAKAYPAVYRNRYTKTQGTLVYAAEVRAWIYAQAIAKHLDIDLKKWFYKQKAECLKNYEDHLRSTKAWK